MGVSVKDVEEFVDGKTNTVQGNVYSALADAQNEIGQIFNNASNNHFGNSYLDLAGLIGAVQPVLFKHKLTLFHTTRPPMNEFEEDHFIEAHLVYTPTGQEIVSTYPLRSKDANDPQKLGASKTYARRYTALAVLGLAAEDDDGNYAAGNTEELPHKTQPKARQAKASGGGGGTGRPASEKQKDFVASLLTKQGVLSEEEQDDWLKTFVGSNMENLTSNDAKKVIDELKGSSGKPAPKRTGGRGPF